MITYRVHVYRSRPICASLLTTSPQQVCLAPEGPAHGLAGRGDGYPLNTDLDWGLSSGKLIVQVNTKCRALSHIYQLEPLG